MLITPYGFRGPVNSQHFSVLLTRDHNFGARRSAHSGVVRRAMTNNDGMRVPFISFGGQSSKKTCTAECLSVLVARRLPSCSIYAVPPQALGEFRYNCCASSGDIPPCIG